MRGRNKPWANDFIDEHQDYLLNVEEDFKNKQSIYLEIGMGKGDFIIQSCQYYPNVFHIGVEMNKSIFAIALKKIVGQELSNIKVVNNDANQLLEWIPSHSIDKIFLNFSDPWPKKRHHKRRLVHTTYLTIFEKLLKKNGQIVFKTDNRGLFDYGLEMFENQHYILQDVAYDYQTIEGDFISEYEARFRSLNQPIYRCVANVVLKED